MLQPFSNIIKSQKFLQNISLSIFIKPKKHFSIKIEKKNEKENPKKLKEFDLVVIGGGSGGLAASQEAAKFGAKVALLDFVETTPHGSNWGIGGTCVNVGCIPKKLFHFSSQIKELMDFSESYGWNFDKSSLKMDWKTLVGNVQDHIHSLNWGYKTKLRDKNISYFNALGKFKTNHIIELNKRNYEKEEIYGDKIIIATGGKPRYPSISGSKFCITSDDLFSLKKPPGKTLIIGASYIALETAGFLKSFGYDTTVMVRSQILRKFDQQIANLIQKNMEKKGIKFMINTTVKNIEKQKENYEVTFCEHDLKHQKLENFETVISAIGRDPRTFGLNLEKIGVSMNKKGKIIHENEQTNIKNIYAIGDVLETDYELTPVAIMQGKLLAQRLFSNLKTKMDYSLIPTTVFTPLEYGFVGLSEEDAIKKYKQENIEVYHSFITPLEFTVPHVGENETYLKVICNKLENEKIIGIHYLGPNAGEIIQGFAVAIKIGLTKNQLTSSVGIHPTCAENFTTLDITKRSGENPKKTGC
ncbi:thioredoxin reductase 1 cytoplasmic [Anaeramoeba ignava]|uniref:thioredoxin-disulfide reductase (NADPH) n=1 Tax=Anaeramoeba ignava TaxID=1746090 RepID=A0A9Q0LUQ2_ANAIG|nr:thioredoxin reductase 1 cytoplasmic [Anaeramoeba ignava]